MKHEIVPCRLSHLRELASRMRAEDRAEIEDFGFKPRHLLIALWRRSFDSRCALVDSEVAACWGDAAPLIGLEGEMWLFTTAAIERMPLAYFREARRDIARRLEVRAALSADMPVNHEKSVRFFSMLGFRPTERDPSPSGERYYRMRIERWAS